MLNDGKKQFRLANRGISFIQLVFLLQEAQEFRNLYYFRLFKGNLLGRLLSYILKVILSPLFLSCFSIIPAILVPGYLFNMDLVRSSWQTLGENCWINQQVTIGLQGQAWSSANWQQCQNHRRGKGFRKY